MRYVIIGGSAAAIGCIEGVRSVDKPGEIILITGETEVELFPSAHFVSLLEGKDHAGQNVVPAGQLYPERCDGESRRAGHHAGCWRQDRAALYRRERLATTGCWRPRAAACSAAPFPGWKRWSVPFASRRCPTPRLWLRRCGRRAACSFWARASRASNAPRASAACACRSPLRTLRPACCLLYWMTRRLPWCSPYGGEGQPFLPEDSAAAFPGENGRSPKRNGAGIRRAGNGRGVCSRTRSWWRTQQGAVDRGILVDGRCATTLPDDMLLRRSCPGILMR